MQRSRTDTVIRRNTYFDKIFLVRGKHERYALQPRIIDLEDDAMDSPAHQSSDRLNSSINVNLIAYLLYFFGGIFGLHHAYLNRPYQGLAWYATCGLFGFGLLRDLYRIPTYVSLCRDDRTNDVAARVRAATIVAREGVPKLSLGRVILMVILALL